MKPNKKTKAQRIVELERKLFEAEAAQIHQHHFASVELDKLVMDKMMGSGVIMTLTTLGGRLTIGPVRISNGLSKEPSRRSNPTWCVATTTHSNSNRWGRRDLFHF